MSISAEELMGVYRFIEQRGGALHCREFSHLPSNYRKAVMARKALAELTTLGKLIVTETSAQGRPAAWKINAPISSSSDNRSVTEPRFLTLKQVCHRETISSATVWRWVREGRFPKPVSLGENTTRWRVSDLEAWESSLSEEPTE